MSQSANFLDLATESFHYQFEIIMKEPRMEVACERKIKNSTET